MDGNTQVVTIAYEETDENLASNIGGVSTVSGYDVGEDFDDVDSFDSFSHGYVITREASYLDIASGEVKTVTYTCYETDTLGCITDPEYLLLSAADVKELYAGVERSNEFEGEEMWFIVEEIVHTYDGTAIKNRQFGYEISTYNTYREEDIYHMIYPIAEGFRGYSSPNTAFCPLFQVSYGTDASYDINLSVFGLESLVVTRPPNKTVYHYDEYVDTTGWEVIAYYTDGTTKDVSSEVQLTSEFYSFGVGAWSKQERYYDSKKKGYNVPIEYESSKAVVNGKEVYINGARKVTGSFFISYTG